MVENPDLEEHELYHLQVGRFIFNFSRLEVGLFKELCHIAQLETTVGKALLSGHRSETLISLIRRCYEARNMEIPPLLERVLQRASLLNNVRNDLVHLTVTSSMGEMVASNRARYMPTKAKEVTVSSAMVDAIWRDTFQARRALEYLDGERRGSPRITSSHYADIHDPWRYKPPEQASSRPDRPRAPKRERQRRSPPGEV